MHDVNTLIPLVKALILWGVTFSIFQSEFKNIYKYISIIQ